MFLVTLFGGAVPDHLHLVELVDTQQASRVLARGAGLPPEAARVRDEAPRKVGAIDDFVPIQVRHRHFGGGNEEEILIADRVHVVLELRELGRARHRGAIHDDRDPDFFIPVLAHVDVDEEVHERPRQARPEAAKDDESRTADLGATRQVDQPALLTDLPVRADALRRTRLAPRAHDRVGLLAAFGNIGEREVGKAQQDVLQRRLRRRQLVLESLDLLAQLTSGGDQLVGGFAGLLAPGDFLRVDVPRRFPLLHGLDDRAPFQLESYPAVQERRHVVELPAPAHAIAQQLDLLAENAGVMHGVERSTRCEKAANVSPSARPAGTT